VLRTGPRRLASLFALLAGCATPEPTPIFVDVAVESGLEFTHVNGMTGERYFSEVVGPGVALFDYDGDGDLDVYLIQGGPLAPEERAAAARSGVLPGDRLFRSDRPAGEGSMPRFVDVTAASGLAADGYGMGVAVGDVDGDGFADLYVTNFGRNQLWRNRADGTFEDVTTPSLAEPRWSTSAAFLDYDLDGDLDLFAVNYVEYRIAQHRPCLNPAGAVEYCGPSGFPPETDRLWRNRGDGTFEDVSGIAGLVDRPGSGLGVVSADFDGNGLPDLYVANDLMPNHLWLNQGDGTFREDALLAGCAVNESGAPEASMGLAVGDFDRDGDEDLFMTHLDTETNTAFVNEGNGLFVDGTNEWGLSSPSIGMTGFGTAPIDYDNDGWLDLIAANGAVKTIAEQRLAGDPLPLREPNLLLRNEDGRFRSVTDLAPVLERTDVSRGLATGDVDNDGDADVLLVNNSGAAQLLRNEVGQGSSWIGVDPAAGGNVGTRVELVAQPRPLLRQSRSAQSYCSASDSRVLLGGAGLGSRGLDLSTPGEGRRRLAAVPAGRYLRLPR
jgi:hypothetical protein